MPVVSIIVPVYNAEKTLDRCVDSILKQTYRDFELILLDDGSTDASGEICDSYKEKDERVSVVHKENTGVSDTRNQGIAMAAGEYIQFLDSDDWITPEATSLFVHTAQDACCDMVISDFYRVIGERVSQKGAIEDDGLMDRAAYANSMMQKPADFYYGVLWNKLYRRSIIEEYHLRMDSEVSWCEDFMFNLEYVRHAERIYALKVPVYYYVKTKGSLVSQGMSMKSTIQMKRNVFTYYNSFYKEVFGEEEYEKRRLGVYRFLIDIAADGELPPIMFSSNYKLGDERTAVSEGVQKGEGFFFDVYREGKLQERLFDIVALKNELTTADVKLLYYLSQSNGDCTMKETTGILDMTKKQVSLSIQKLLQKDLIALQEKEKSKEKGKKAKQKEKEQEQEKKPKQSVKRYVLLPEADAVLSEILFMLNDFEQIQYEGFTQEEIEIYERLNEKRNENIRMAL